MAQRCALRGFYVTKTAAGLSPLPLQHILMFLLLLYLRASHLFIDVGKHVRRGRKTMERTDGYRGGEEQTEPEGRNKNKNSGLNIYVFVVDSKIMRGKS